MDQNGQAGDLPGMISSVLSDPSKMEKVASLLPFISKMFSNEKPRPPEPAAQPRPESFSSGIMQNEAVMAAMKGFIEAVAAAAISQAAKTDIGNGKNTDEAPIHTAIPAEPAAGGQEREEAPVSRRAPINGGYIPAQNIQIQAETPEEAEAGAKTEAEAPAAASAEKISAGDRDFAPAQPAPDYSSLLASLSGLMQNAKPAAAAPSASTPSAPDYSSLLASLSGLMQNAKPAAQTLAAEPAPEARAAPAADFGSLLSSLTGGLSGAKEGQSANVERALDTLKGFSSATAPEKDDRMKLLLALKPFMRDTRKGKIDTAIKYMSAAKIINLFGKNGFV